MDESLYITSFCVSLLLYVDKPDFCKMHLLLV